MSERMEWRRLYGARETLFIDGVAAGDFYLTSSDVYRVRLWPPDRLQGGRERLVLDQETAKTTLLGMVDRARREAGE
jgi:hypothetical protein